MRIKIESQHAAAVAQTDTFRSFRKLISKSPEHTERSYAKIVQLGSQIASQFGFHTLDDFGSLADKDRCLQIVGDSLVHQIPWELLTVDGSFLAQHLPLTRNHTAAPWPYPPERRAAKVLVSDAHELVVANSETDNVQRRLRMLAHDHPGDLRMATGDQRIQTSWAMSNWLNECRWLHFAGHAVEIDGRQRLKLQSMDTAHSEVFSPEDLSVCDALPEFLFLNACSVLQWPLEDLDESLVGQFVRRGVRWLIGPVTPVFRRDRTDIHRRILRGNHKRSVFSGSNLDCPEKNV